MEHGKDQIILESAWPSDPKAHGRKSDGPELAMQHSGIQLFKLRKADHKIQQILRNFVPRASLNHL